MEKILIVNRIVQHAGFRIVPQRVERGNFVEGRESWKKS
jgi:hypothetical protein